MRSRTVREGSVGLLLLLGVGVFVGLLLWIRGFSFGKSNYKVVLEFANAAGIQKGAEVRYRGVKVGKISVVRPGPNGIEVETEITPSDLIISHDVVVEANQSGLIGQTSIDITPLKPLPTGIVVAKPLDKNCDPTIIVCDGSRIPGQVGVSLDELIRNTTKLTSTFSDPELFANVKAATRNASVAAESVIQVSRDLSGLTKATQQQLGTFNKTANKFSATADQLRLTAAQGNRLISDIDSVLTTNRTAIVTTLNNLSQTSGQLRATVSSLTPKINRLTQGKLIQNLETLSANAAQASANLRDVSSVLNKPTNRLVLQQTLDSARVTFQNAQKITSDLDDLTGDPKVRDNIRKLINGLSGLVSSTQDLQQQVHVAQTLDSVKAAVNTPNKETSAAFSLTGKSSKHPHGSKSTQALPPAPETAQLAAILAEWQRKQQRYSPH